MSLAERLRNAWSKRSRADRVALTLMALLCMAALLMRPVWGRLDADLLVGITFLETSRKSGPRRPGIGSAAAHPGAHPNHIDPWGNPYWYHPRVGWYSPGPNGLEETAGAIRNDTAWRVGGGSNTLYRPEGDDIGVTWSRGRFVLYNRGPWFLLGLAVALGLAWGGVLRPARSASTSVEVTRAAGMGVAAGLFAVPLGDQVQRWVIPIALREALEGFTVLPFMFAFAGGVLVVTTLIVLWFRLRDPLVVDQE